MSRRAHPAPRTDPLTSAAIPRVSLSYIQALAMSLAAFTLGIETGQLALLAVILGAMAGMRLLSRPGSNVLRHTTLGLCGVIALYWTVTRGIALV